LVELDDLEIEILKILERDTRISYRKIANKLSISVGTTHNRIKKLKNKGILKGYSLLYDTKKLGFNLQFLLMISINGRHIQEVLEQISQFPAVTEIHQMTGEYTAVVFCRFKQIEEVQQLLHSINEIGYINKLTSNMILNTFLDRSHRLFDSKEQFENSDYPKPIEQFDELKAQPK
jgi:DNA-binding Lrp family transcriptional regulator